MYGIKIVFATSTLSATEPPVVRWVIAVVQRLNLLAFLAPADTCWIAGSVEFGRELHQPLGLNGQTLMQVLLAGQHKAVVDEPLRLPIEQRAGRMHVDRLPLD